MTLTPLIGRSLAVAKIIHAIQNMRASGAVVSATTAGQRWLATVPSLWTTPRLAPRASSIGSPAVVCPDCHVSLDATNETYLRLAVCESCGHHFIWSAKARIQQLADPGTFRRIGWTIQAVDVLKFVDNLPYTTRLKVEREKTGLSDAAIVGRCQIGQVDTVLAVLDFHFMGGSMGAVVGEQIARAFEYALHHRLPMVTVVNSGGARMQEGTMSLMQMPKTASAAQHFHAAGLFYCSILASPTTGGVWASFANLGDVILAEPKAIISFAGPRVAEQALGQRLPEGSNRAEMLLDAGMIDAIVPREDLPQVVGSLLQATLRPLPDHRKSHPVPIRRSRPASREANPEATNSAWESIQVARHPDRPTATDYIAYLSPKFLELHGDRCYGDDPTVVTGLGKIDGHNVMFIGEQRRAQDRDGQRTYLRPKPEGFRKAIRMMQLAGQLGCPVVTFIDTIGADPSLESERHGMAWSLAHCLATMSDLPVPTITAIIGEGASGGAVVLALADHVMMLQQAIYEVIAPESAATILYRDAQQTEQIAVQLKLTAADCLALGIVETIIPEPSAGAHTDPEPVMKALQAQVQVTLAALEHLPVRRLLLRRYRKFRGMGRVQRRSLAEIESRLVKLLSAGSR